MSEKVHLNTFLSVISSILGDSAAAADDDENNQGGFQLIHRNAMHHLLETVKDVQLILCIVYYSTENAGYLDLDLTPPRRKDVALIRAELTACIVSYCVIQQHKS